VERLLLLSTDPFGISSDAGWRVVAEIPATAETIAREFWFADDLEHGSLLLSPEEAQEDASLTDALLAWQLEQDQANANDLAVLRFGIELEDNPEALTTEAYR